MSALRSSRNSTKHLSNQSNFWWQTASWSRSASRYSQEAVSKQFESLDRLSRIAESH